VGPAFVAVAKRYKNDNGAVNRLAQKIILGGGGVWGEHAMSAHPQVSTQDASEMVKYILSLADAKQQKQNLPLQGTVAFNQHTEKEKNGQYTLLAAYTDKGAKVVGPLTNSEVITFRPAKVATVDADKLNEVDRWGNSLGNAKAGSYYMFRNIDLTHIKQLTYSVAGVPDAKVELRLKSPGGLVISSTTLSSTSDLKKKTNVTATLTPTTGKHDLYFVVVKPQATGEVLNLESIQFQK
jgi:cytochrome c